MLKSTKVTKSTTQKFYCVYHQLYCGLNHETILSFPKDNLPLMKTNFLQVPLCI